jgi:hypothetical protein
MIKEILQRYLDRVAPLVDMKEEEKLAEEYLELFSRGSENADLNKEIKRESVV